LEAIIESYTRESGVRELEKKIGKILRKSARQYATDGYFAKTEIKPSDLYDFLGAPEYTRDKYQGNDYAGVVTGLAWTAVGGEILFVETSLSRGKGGRLTLTGNLGDVMKESAMLALEYIKAHASILTKKSSTTGISISTFPKAQFRKTVRRQVLRWPPPWLLP
jgi:ATP-dependent Lon protease